MIINVFTHNWLTSANTYSQKKKKVAASKEEKTSAWLQSVPYIRFYHSVIKVKCTIFIVAKTVNWRAHLSQNYDVLSEKKPNFVFLYDFMWFHSVFAGSVLKWLAEKKNSFLYTKLDSFSDTSNRDDTEMEVDQFDSSSLDISSVDFQQANDDNLSVHQR